MRFYCLTLTLAVAGLLGVAGVASAQQGPSFQMRGSAGGSVPYQARRYVWDEPTNDGAVPHAPDASTSAPPSDASKANGNGNGEKKEEEAAPAEEKPWGLFDNCCWLKCHDIHVGGFVAQSFTWNPANPADGYNGPMTWTDRANAYQLNQVWMWAYKEAKGDKCCWDWGWRADAVYGTDTRFIPGLGMDLGYHGQPEWNRADRFLGVVTPQFFAEAKKDDTTFRVGRFISPTGFYTVQTYQNFFTVLPYTFQYGEPFTHLGAHVTQKLNDNLTVMGGVCRGWDNVWDADPRVLGMTMITVTGDCKDTLNFWNMFGNEFADGTYTRTAFRWIQTMVYMRPITDKLTWYLQSDFGFQCNAGGARPGTDYWYGINQYAYYKFNDCWSWGVNAEWFRDDGGFRVGGFLVDRNGTNPGTGDRGLSAATRSGFNGSFYRCMFGPRYTPNKNIIVRSAAAFDWYDGPRNAANQLPYDGGNRTNQFAWINDVIFMY